MLPAWTVTGLTGSLKRTCTEAFIPIPVAPSAGTMAVTTGALLSTGPLITTSKVNVLGKAVAVSSRRPVVNVVRIVCPVGNNVSGTKRNTVRVASRLRVPAMFVEPATVRTVTVLGVIVAGSMGSLNRASRTALGG